MNPYTTIAIQKFETVQRKTFQLAKAQDDYNRAILKVPKEDLGDFYEQTDKLIETYEKKIEQMQKVRHRK